MVFYGLSSLLVSVAAIHAAAGALTRRVACPDGVNTATNAACCPLYAVRDDMQANLYDGGACNAEVHESLRLTFHDAIGYSPALAAAGSFAGGGADGSILTFSDVEAAFFANAGLDEMIELQKPYITKYNMTPGDVVQFAGAVGLSNCPGAPQLEFLLGRTAATAASPTGLIPAPFDTVDAIIERFADVDFSVDEIVALLASHSVAAASHIDTTVPESPLDSTPGVFDTQFFVETSLNGTMYPGTSGNIGEALSAIAGELRLLSDHELARDSRTACEWQSYVNNQSKIQSAFRAAMARMAVIGQDSSTMIDCTEVIPTASSFTSAAFIPAGLTYADIEQSCDSTPFPTLSVVAGAATSVAAVAKS